jgi:hypothetical protein
MLSGFDGSGVLGWSLLCVLCATLVAPLVLRKYRRRTLALQRHSNAGIPGHTAAPPPNPARHFLAAGLSPAVLMEEAIRRSRELTRGLLRAVGAYAVTFAVLTESVPGASFFEGDAGALGWGQRLLRVPYVTAFLAVLALTAVMLASSLARSGRLVLRLMLPALVLGMLLAVWIDPSLSFREHWW